MPAKIFVFIIFCAIAIIMGLTAYKLLCMSGWLGPKPIKEKDMTSSIEKLAAKYHKTIRLNRISAKKLRDDAGKLEAEARRLRSAADKIDTADLELVEASRAED
jgi:hypothetical protein